jgi:hypothetical protein
MTATVISNAAPFGALTNDTVAALFEVGEALARLNAAVATAASGFNGTPGTEYEDGTNFGVAADVAEPGVKGSDYAYAVGQLSTAWDTFWTTAKPYIEQLDNGVRGV